MKRSTVLLVILILLGCSAAFGEGLATLGFLDADGETRYCDFENFSYGTTLASGIDDLRYCPYGADGSMIGVVTTVSGGGGGGEQPQLPVTGTLVVLADSYFDSDCYCYSGFQGLLITQTKASKNHLGWEFLYNVQDGFGIYLNSYGYLTKELPPYVYGPPAKLKPISKR